MIYWILATLTAFFIKGLCGFANTLVFTSILSFGIVNANISPVELLIVAESLGYMEANCDGCSSGLAEMYQAYIDGEKELRDINMEFHAGYVSGEEVPGRRSCPM